MRGCSISGVAARSTESTLHVDLTVKVPRPMVRQCFLFVSQCLVLCVSEQECKGKWELTALMVEKENWL